MAEQESNQGVKPDGAEQLEIKVTVPQADSFIYSNIVGVAISPMDVRINFAEAGPSGNCVTKVGIVLTPETASSLALILLDQVMNFSRQVGPIRNEQWNAVSSGMADIKKTLMEAKRQSLIAEGEKVNTAA